MANYVRTNFLVPPAPGTDSILFRNSTGQITFEVYIRSISAIWQDGNLVKIKVDSTDKAIVLDFSSPPEALVALQSANSAIDSIRTTMPFDDQTIIDYINLQISQTYFAFHQVAATTSWYVPHTIGYRPGVTVTDDSFVEIEGLVSLPDITDVLVQFNQAVSGWVFLS
jgi:hypothetical protein